jgi:hypothetical protein
VSAREVLPTRCAGWTLGGGGVAARKLNGAGETSLCWDKATRMTQRAAVADWKAVWNVGQSVYDDMVFHHIKWEFQDGLLVMLHLGD